MLIESQEELRAFATNLLDQAKNHLSAEDDLKATVLMMGPQGSVDLDASTMPPQFVSAMLRQLAKQDATMEAAAVVALGYAVKRDQLIGGSVNPSEEPDRYLVICVQLSHREWGSLAVAARVDREGPKQFQFGEADWSETVMEQPLFENLWPKPRLN